MSRWYVSDDEIRAHIESELQAYRPGGEPVPPEKASAIVARMMVIIREEMRNANADREDEDDKPRPPSAAYSHHCSRNLPREVWREYPGIEEASRAVLEIGDYAEKNFPGQDTAKITDIAERRILRRVFCQPEKPITKKTIATALENAEVDAMREKATEAKKHAEVARRREEEIKDAEPMSEGVLALLDTLRKRHTDVVRPILLVYAEKMASRGRYLIRNYLEIHWMLVDKPQLVPNLRTQNDLRREANRRLREKIQADAKSGSAPEISELAKSLAGLSEKEQAAKFTHEKAKAIAAFWKRVEKENAVTTKRKITREELDSCKAIMAPVAIGAGGGVPVLAKAGAARRAADGSRRTLMWTGLILSGIAALASVAAFLLFSREQVLEKGEAVQPVVAIGNPPAPAAAPKSDVKPKEPEAPKKDDAPNKKNNPLVVVDPKMVLRMPEGVLKAGRRAPGFVGAFGEAKNSPFPPVQPKPPAPVAAAEPPLPWRPVTVLVPMYVYPLIATKPNAKPTPHPAWASLVQEHSDVANIVAIVNPGSGPGQAGNPDYVREVFEKAPKVVASRKTKNRLKMIGYIAVGRGNKPAEVVREEISKWIRFYPSIDGFFIDESPADKPGVAYVQGVKATVVSAWSASMAGKAKRAPILVLNPGVFCDDDYFSLADCVCVFENEASKFRLFEEQARATARKHGDKLAALVHTVLKDDPPWQEIFRQVAQSGISTLYVTDVVHPGHPGQTNLAAPWDQLPTHWPEFMRFARLWNLKN